MSTPRKVLPVSDEFTAVSTIASTPDDHDAPATKATTLPPLQSYSGETVVKYLTGTVGEATERSRGSERDVVAPLKHDSVGQVLSSSDPLTQPVFIARSTTQPPPALARSGSSPQSKRPPGPIKRSGTVSALLTQPSKAEVRARQRAMIERRSVPSKKHSVKEIAAYKVDQYISTRRGQTITLAFVGLIFVVLGGCILQGAQPAQEFSEMIWMSWTFLGDAGSHTAMTQPFLRFLGILMTLVGILYFSVIMGFVVDGIREKMDNLKKGKSRVAEEKHTLMLGWTDKSISLIRQICLANASEKGGVVVVLADQEKEALEAELASHLRFEELRGTRVIFRTGTPLLSVDLLKVAAHRARSIIIMANGTGDADRSDAAVLRTVLSLKTLPELSGHIVAELRDIDNEPLVRLVGGDDVEILVSHDVIGRLVLTAARSPGLARVFSCLLGFDGNEFYFKEWPECVGVRFGDLSERFPNAIPLGIKRACGDVLISPDFNTVLEKGDQIMVLAEDDDTYKACPPAPIDKGVLPAAIGKVVEKERILMCGWRRDIRDMIQLLDSLVCKGTELHMLCEEPIHLRNKLLLESGLNVELLKNLRLVHHYGNTAIRRHLELLPLDSYTSVMILADESRETDIMHSDSHTLASLLLVRDLQNKMGIRRGRTESAEEYCKCICEVLDPRTQRTISTSATILKLSEFIQSNELVSCILAMISESRDVRVILDELLGPDGASFEVERSARYCGPTETVSFWQLAKRAMDMGDLLCGYQLRGSLEETVLNPVDKNVSRTWAGVDLIVLRKKGSQVLIHQPLPPAIQADDFERTSRARMSKSSFVRQQLLEALVQEQELANIEQLNGQERDLLTKAVRSYVDTSQAERVDGIETTPIDARAIRSLINVARVLADTLENTHLMSSSQRSMPTRDGSGDESVTEFDMASN